MEELDTAVVHLVDGLFHIIRVVRLIAGNVIGNDIRLSCTNKVGGRVTDVVKGGMQLATGYGVFAACGNAAIG